ncbi:MAG: lysylphosphatidylglycerol synthase domain-containing protein [Aquificaceae bacterium]
MKWIIGSLITAVFIYFVISSGILDDILNALKSVDQSRLLAGFLLYLASQIARALRWWLLLSVRFDWVLCVSFVNVMLNNLLPARIGELSWFYFAKKAKIELSASLWVFFIARGFDLLSVVFFVLVVFEKEFFSMALLVFSLVVFVFIKKLRVSALEFLRKISLKTYIGVFVLSVASLLLKFIGFVLVFNLWLEFKEASMSFVGGELSSILPFHGLMGIGTFEAGFALPAAVRGQEALRWLSIGSAYHFILLSFSLFLGLVGALYLRKLDVSYNVGSANAKY